MKLSVKEAGIEKSIEMSMAVYVANSHAKLKMKIISISII